jgi:hypothetical protein
VDNNLVAVIRDSVGGSHNAGMLSA